VTAKIVCRRCNGKGTPRIHGPGICNECDGRGYNYHKISIILPVPGAGEVLARKKCPNCDGTGVRGIGRELILCSKCKGHGKAYYLKTCSRCKGKAQVKCPTCDGEGKVFQ